MSISATETENIAAYRALVRRTAIDVASAHSWCDHGLNEALTELDLPPVPNRRHSDQLLVAVTGLLAPSAGTAPERPATPAEQVSMARDLLGDLHDSGVIQPGWSVGAAVDTTRVTVVYEETSGGDRQQVEVSRRRRFGVPLSFVVSVYDGFDDRVDLHTTRPFTDYEAAIVEQTVDADLLTPVYGRAPSGYGLEIEDVRRVVRDDPATVDIGPGDESLDDFQDRVHEVARRVYGDNDWDADDFEATMRTLGLDPYPEIVGFTVRVLCRASRTSAASVELYSDAARAETHVTRIAAQIRAATGATVTVAPAVPADDGVEVAVLLTLTGSYLATSLRGSSDADRALLGSHALHSTAVDYLLRGGHDESAPSGPGLPSAVQVDEITAVEMASR